MYFSVFDVLLLIGITQGVIAAILLLVSKDKQTSNIFLALAILSFCMLFIKIVMNYSGLLGKPEFRYFPNAFELSTAPLFYFYFLALTEKNFAWNPIKSIHFIPFVLAQGFAIFVYLKVYNLPTNELKDQAVNLFHFSTIKEVEDWLIVISILSYLFIGCRKYFKFQKQVRDNTADSAYPTLSWLKTILMLSAILITFLIVNMLLSRMTNLDYTTDVHWKIYFIYQAAITYYLGFMAYRQPEIDLEQIYPEESKNKLHSITEQESKSIITKLTELMEGKKIYLEPDLNISQLAKAIEISPSTLSYVINGHFNKSFRALVNHYRVEDIKVKLLDPENKASILSLALESGFNSEASFYRVFKNNTGLSPKAFIATTNSHL